MIEILLNGERREIADDCSVAELVQRLNLKIERLAVELNREVVPRRLWPETKLRAGDRLEIVHFVGGG